MSNDDFFIPPPAFKADDALVQIRRALRDLKLTERGNAFESHGKRVVEVSLEAGAVAAKIARRAMLTPEWDRLTLRSVADQRKFVDEVKKRLARWESEE